MERRNFLQLLSLGLLYSCMKKNELGLLSPAIAKEMGSYFLFLENVLTSKCYLRLSSWKDHSFSDFEIPMQHPHSLIQSKADPSVLYIFELFGSILKMDLKTGHFQKVDHLNKKNMSYGHGLEMNSGRLLCSDVDVENRVAKLVVRSSKDLKIIENLQKVCTGTHHMAMMPGKKLIVAGIATEFGLGETGAVEFLDADNLKIKKRINLPNAISHVFPVGPEEVVALGFKVIGDPIRPQGKLSAKQNSMNAIHKVTYESAEIFTVNLNGTVRALPRNDQNDLFRFNFAYLKIPNSAYFITSHMGADRVIVWKNNQIFKTINLPIPTNLISSDDGREFMVIAGGKAHIFTADKFEHIKTLGEGYAVVGVSNYKNA